MADLFAGAPESWIRATGDDAHQQLTPQVLEWINKTSRINSPQYQKTLQAIHDFKRTPVLPGQSDQSGALAWDTIMANKEVANRQAISDAKINATNQLLAKHADPHWQPPDQYGAGFDEWARNKVDSLGDASSRVAQSVRGAVGSLAGQIDSGQE